MLAEMNKRIEEARERIHYKEKWRKRMEALQAQIKGLEHMTSTWRKQLGEEEKDVARLTGISLSNLWHTLTGQKDKKLKQEEAEVLETKLKYEQAAHSLAEVARELEELRGKREQLVYAEAELKSLMLEKEQLIKRHYPLLADELNQLTDLKAEAAIHLKEWKEALYEGRGALEAMEAAASSLDSARNWGVYDMLGGGHMATKIKHNYMETAIDRIHYAREKLRRFTRELKDVQVMFAVQPLELDDFMRFADYFFDGFFSDYAVQERIHSARNRLADNIAAVRSLVAQLDTESRKCQSEIDLLDRRYSSLIATSE